MMMKNVKSIGAWLAFLLLLSCSNLHKLCSHNNKTIENSFAYRQNEQGHSTFFPSPVNNLIIQSAELTWNTLKDVTYVTKYNEQFKMDFRYPRFGSQIRNFEGNRLHITGYVIPLDMSKGLYALSKFPYAACYFCGKSGPESVISLKFSTPPGRIKLDSYKTMEGILVLNDSDVNDFIYIFNDVKEYIE